MSYEPLTQSEFVELLSDLIDDGRENAIERALIRGDAETIEDTELHTLQVTGVVDVHYRSHLRIKMGNGQRFRITVEEIP